MHYSFYAFAATHQLQVYLVISHAYDTMGTVQRAYKFIHRKFTHTVHGSSINYWEKRERSGFTVFDQQCIILTCDHMIEGCLNIWGV